MLSDLSGLIGNTPMYRLKLRYKGIDQEIFAKAEHYNFTGSIKDRMAYYVFREGLRQGFIKPGMSMVEATSGNTGISFAAIGAALGLKVTIYMPDWMSEERKKLISAFGAQINLVSREENGFLGSIAKAEAMCLDSSCYLPRQFENQMNPLAHYHSTGPEIAKQLASVGLQPAAFVAGVGTGGTIMGTGGYLKEHFPHIKLHPLEPANSPTLSTGHKIGKHRIQGISDDFVPDIMDLSLLDEIVQADDSDAINTARLLARHGIGVGISSGANLVGAVKLAQQLGPDHPVVTVFSDDNKKYLSTDLMVEQTAHEGFISNDLEFISFETIAPLDKNQL